MLDFTSALYLGNRHSHRSLPPWERLTLGAPAALTSPPIACAVARSLAAVQGSERTTLGSSTLHLIWDLFGMLAAEQVSIYMDSGVYPILRWGVEHAAARGVRTRSFRHHDADDLRRLLRRPAGRVACPVIVTDGFCPSCGNFAPIMRYLESIREHGGYMVVDDTQALGIFGYAPDRSAPYGKGGGGVRRYFNVAGPDLLVISSLSKAFGAPIAGLSGSSKIVRKFEALSDTRVHCSPPSMAAIHAAQHALGLNDLRGDATRLRLAHLVSRFRKRLKEVNLATTGGLFPVQTLAGVSGDDARSLHERLLRSEIKAVLRSGNHKVGAQISFIVTALHDENDIDRVADAIARAARRLRHKKNFGSKCYELPAQL